MACNCNNKGQNIKQGCTCTCGGSCGCHQGGITTTKNPCNPLCALPSPCDYVQEIRCTFDNNTCYQFTWYGQQLMPQGLSQEAINQYLLNLITKPSNMTTTANCPIVYYVHVYMHNNALVVEFLPAINESNIVSYSIQVVNMITSTTYIVATITPGSTLSGGYYYYTISPTAGIPLNPGDQYMVQVISNSAGGTCHGLDYIFKIGANKEIISC